MALHFIFLMIFLLFQDCRAFVIHSAPSRWRRIPFMIYDVPEDTSPITTITATENQFNASGSFGSLLMQMQKNEQEAMKLAQASSSNNNTLLENAVELDPVHKQKPKDIAREREGRQTKEEKKKKKRENEEQQQQQQEWDILESSELSVMDDETAKQLDMAVKRMPRDDLLQDVKLLPVNTLYATSFIMDNQPKNNITETKVWNRPELYLERIERDRRHLSVGIAASTEDVSQWRLFCQERGGLFPILETIREGVRYIREEQNQDTALDPWSTSSSSSSTLNIFENEEAFQAACSACRAIRDLCAISLELAAIITDSILRANAAWNGGLMDDFRIILECTNNRNNHEYLDTSQWSREARRLEKKRFMNRLHDQRESRSRCKLYVLQLLLAMVVASDDAVTAIRSTEGLSDAVLTCSSYAPKEQRRRWRRYPVEIVKWLWRLRTTTDDEKLRRPFIEAANVANDYNGQVQRIANQVLAAIGRNKWIPKTPGQKGLRILSLDGGGSRGMAAITAVNYLMESIGHGADVADSFDMIVGTSTGGIISFLLGLKRDTSAEAVVRYQQLIDKIFVKRALSTPMMIFTTATYDESHFMEILIDILEENSMLDSRADPTVPLVCCLTSKMSSTPTHVALFRNYNYPGGELPDPFIIEPEKAREELGLNLNLEHEFIRSGSYRRKKVVSVVPGMRVSEGSRHPGSFRVLQRYALRASTAAPTVFKPVMMGGEMYCDGGIVASNPTAVAIHEARALFPDIPIELVVSVGTGAFIEQKSAPRVGWDGIIGQIVNSATDAEQIHHILEDILGTPAVLGGEKSAVSQTRYFRFNPIIGLPEEFPIDVTDPEKLKKLSKITTEYMEEPEQQEKISRIAEIMYGRRTRRKFLSKIQKKR